MNGVFACRPRASGCGGVVREAVASVSRTRPRVDASSPVDDSRGRRCGWPCRGGRLVAAGSTRNRTADRSGRRCAADGANGRSGDHAVERQGGELRQGGNRFRIEFRSARTNALVDVGAVQLGAAMTMPGMAMTGTVSVAPAGRPGVYEAKGEFSMSGTWHMTLEWNGPAGRGSASFEGDVR